jgi:hypothetical protein
VSDVSKDVITKLQKAGITKIPTVNVINSNELQHALKRHGINSTTLSNVEIPLTKSDFKHIPNILKNYDTVHISSKLNKR